MILKARTVVSLVAALLTGCTTAQPEPVAVVTPAATIPSATATVVPQTVSSQPPTPSPTLLPSATPALTPIVLTPYPLPTAADFPGDMTLTLSYAVAETGMPHTAIITTTISGGADNSFELYCGETTWDYGEDEAVTAIPECVPWTPDFRYSRVSAHSHTYKQAGTYSVFVEMRADTRPDGVLVGVARVLRSNILEVTVP